MRYLNGQILDRECYKTDINDYFKKNVAKRLKKAADDMQIKASDMTVMLDLDLSTCDDILAGDNRITNDKLIKMYNNGFDMYYIITGEKLSEMVNDERFSKFDDQEIESLLRSFYCFVRDYRNKYKSLNNIYMKYQFQIYYIINKNDKKNIYQIISSYDSIIQSDMAIMCGYSLNKYKKIKDNPQFPNLDGKSALTLYKSFNLSPLLFIEKRMAYINEICRVAYNIEDAAKKELGKINDSLYKLLYV